MIIERITNKHIDPVSFERPLSESYRYGKIWNREIPDSLRMSLSGLRAMNRFLEPEEIKKASRSVLCFRRLDTGVMVAFSRKTHTKQVAQFTTFEDTWDRPSEVRVNSAPKGVGRIQAGVFPLSKVHLRSATVLSFSKPELQSPESLLRKLKAMLDEEDEPDFLHRPTKYAYELAEQLIKDSYTHYIGSAPVATIAPDGEGGASVEWKSADGSTVRLIVPASQDGKHYTYSRDSKRSHIDYLVSGLTIAQKLRSVFTH